jgi:hypothetical protein
LFLSIWYYGLCFICFIGYGNYKMYGHGKKSKNDTLYGIG